ncbi:hypothetical protein [Alteromonas gracilis]|uniref:hypothetical protein n=1 Tax=Alteromonas gracilis TaxID=1479524 RepID=UPI003735F698
MNILNKLFIPSLLVASALSGCSSDSSALSVIKPSDPPVHPRSGDVYDSEVFEINNAQVKYEPVIDAFVFTIETNGDAGSLAPVPIGQVDGAPVLGYVFVTDLSPTDIGYRDVEGTVALGITSHPDFDDTPLWDEDNNEAYDDDGIVYHSHWVVLENNELAGEGLAVVQAEPGDSLTPTSPMPMYLDSPGFTVLEKGREISVIVPTNAVKRNTTFTSRALTAYLEVGIVDESPLLKVERFYSKPGAPIIVQNSDRVPVSNWPEVSTAHDDDTFNLINTTIDYLEEIDSLVFSMETQAPAAIKTVEPIGEVNGAPVLGYVFPTSLSPAAVGFKNIDGGILALAVTTHPDFDDTPLWDENANGDYLDDGVVYHTHWVALVPDEASGAGLSVPYVLDETNLPPTAPMPMYLDSPNFHAYASGNKLSVIVPTQRVDNITTFNFDGVTATMNVDATGEGPVLRVNGVIDVQSGDLSLPYTVTEKHLTDF